MTNNEKQYYIFLRSNNLKVPCTKEQFNDYYRDINAYRRTQMNHNRCVYPPSKWLMCDMDCHTCPYRTTGDILYFDNTITDDYGHEKTHLDYLQEKMPDLITPPLEDFVSEAIYFKEILNRLCEIMPQAIKIGKLRQLGLSEEAIAKEIGVGRKTYAYRIKKAQQILENEFPDFLKFF